jgi:predicted ATPase
MAFKGWAAPEVRQVLLPVRDICVGLGDADSIIVAQSVMAGHKQTTGELKAAYDIASELLETGVSMSEPRIQITGASSAAGASHYLGMPEESVRHSELLAGLYRHERDASLIEISNHNPKCWALWAASYSLWELGRYREARAASEEQLEMARTIAHPWNLASSLTGGSDVISFLGDWDCHLELIAEARELGQKYELPFVDFICDFHEGFARISAKDFAVGEQTLRQGLNVWEESGGTSELTQGYALLAEALTGLGRYDSALSDVIKASEWMEKTDERYWEPEIYRVRAEIDLLRTGGSAELAEAGFLRALDISRQRKTKTWELRAATSLAKLWQRQGKPRQVHELLDPIYEWFQEGIETPELKQAKALLEGLAA